MSLASTRKGTHEMVKSEAVGSARTWVGFTPDTWIPDTRTPCYGNDDFTSDDITVMRKAARLCGSCPFASECLTQALDIGDRTVFGVWGGKVFMGGGKAPGICRECGAEFTKTKVLRLYCEEHFIRQSDNPGEYSRREARLSGRKMGKTPTTLTDEQKQAVRDEYEEGIPYLHGEGTDHESRRTRSNAKELMSKYNISRVYLRRILRGQ